MSNNNEMLGGLNNLLKDIDLEELTSLISSLSIKGKDTSEKDPKESKFDRTSLNSLISTIDLEEVRSLITGLNFDRLEEFGLLNSKSDSQRGSGLLNIEELQDSLNEVIERIQNFNKSE